MTRVVPFFAVSFVAQLLTFSGPCDAAQQYHAYRYNINYNARTYNSRTYNSRTYNTRSWNH
jgi:hypothetical protein